MRRAWIVLVILLLALAVVSESSASSSRGPQMKLRVAQMTPAGETPTTTGADDDPSSPGTQVNPASGTSRSISVDVTASDDNGHNDVTGVTVTVYKSDQTTEHVVSTAATKSSGSGKSATWTGTFSMAHHDAPGEYWVKAVVSDRDGGTSTKWSNFTYQSMSALSVATASVSLNPAGDTDRSLNPGDSSHGEPSIVNLTNAGNTVIDFEYYGTDLTNASTGEAIPIGNVHLSLSPDMSSETPFASTATTMRTFDLQPGADSVGSIYLAIHVPSTLRSGDYSGSLTISAVQDS